MKVMPPSSDGMTITIRRTVQYVTGAKYEYIDENSVFHKGQIIEKEPKTKSSARSIAVDAGVISLLREYRARWLQQHLLNGDRWIETDKLFIKENGGVMHPDSLTDFTKKFIKANNLPHFSPHSLRHTNISLMIAAGVDIKTVSSRAGHANITTICLNKGQNIKIQLLSRNNKIPKPYRFGICSYCGGRI